MWLVLVSNTSLCLLPSECRESWRGSSHNSRGLGGSLSVLYSCVICLSGLIIKNLVHFYKGSSLQIMIPLHSLPMGCVCNFLEYKSCIIHVYQRATSINYVSLLGAHVFTTSSVLSILPLASFLNQNTNQEFAFAYLPLSCSLLSLGSRGSDGLCPSEKPEKDERQQWAKVKSLPWRCDVNALI